MEILTVKEVAERLRCSDDTVYRLVKQGRLKSFKLNSALRIPADSLNDLMLSPPPAPEKPVTPKRPVRTGSSPGLFL